MRSEELFEGKYEKVTNLDKTRIGLFIVIKVGRVLDFDTVFKPVREYNFKDLV